MKHRWTWFAAGLGCVWLSAALAADTLVMRDGRRVEGEVIGIRDGVVEFDGQRGGFFSGRERIRVDRADVLRIDFEENRRGRSDRDELVGGGGRPSGLREREVSVESRVAWTDTG